MRPFCNPQRHCNICVRFFAILEGSIIAKATTQHKEDTYSQAAVLANICHEYKAFGNEAFVDNRLRYAIIEIDDKNFIARPVFNFVLCFVCGKEASLGLVRNKVEMLACQLE